MVVVTQSVRRYGGALVWVGLAAASLALSNWTLHRVRARAAGEERARTQSQSEPSREAPELAPTRVV